MPSLCPPQSAAARTCPAAGCCGSVATTACGVRAAAASLSAGQRSAPTSATSTAQAVRWGSGAGAHGMALARGVASTHDGANAGGMTGAHSVPPTAASLPPTGFSARTRPRDSTVRCSAAAHGWAMS